MIKVKTDQITQNPDLGNKYSSIMISYLAFQQVSNKFKWCVKNREDPLNLQKLNKIKNIFLILMGSLTKVWATLGKSVMIEHPGIYSKPWDLTPAYAI